MTKKRKLSGLSGLELTLAYHTLMQLQIAIGEEVEDEAGEDDIALAKHVAEMINLMQSRLEGPQDTLTDKLNIQYAGLLQPKLSLDELIKSTKCLGNEKFWSSEAMYRHLEVLESLVSRKTEGCARAWIDTFFFRASAMVPDNKRMILQKTSTTISGHTDYTAIVAQSEIAGQILAAASTLRNLQKYAPSGFFVVEGKLGTLANHIPQAVAEIYSCAKYLKKDVVRGALTNGREWIFLIVYLHKDDDGGMYKQSFQLDFVIRQEKDQDKPDVIAGVLSHWIQHGFEDIGLDDWFEDSKAN